MSDSDSAEDKLSTSNRLLIGIMVIASVVLLSWAIATVFEIQMVKSFALVVLLAFGALIAVLLAGVA